MRYTLGDDPTEYYVRVHGGDTPGVIKEGVKRIHPGRNPEMMMIDGGILEDDDPIGDWLSRTGKSHFVTNWRMAREFQKFWLWTPTGDKDLGDEELEGRQPNEVWTSLRNRNAGLQELKEYRLFVGK
jgi:hypothetical protein